MIDLFRNINQKINSIIWYFASTGIILIVLSILIIVYDVILRLLVGLFVLAMAFTFLHIAYKLWTIKKDIEDHFKL
jgi:hypothetical protein